MGQFDYDDEKKYYIQRSTEQSHEDFKAVYLYPTQDDYWYVGSTPGKKRGWLRNPNPSKTLPTSGWQYADGTGTWPADPTLTVTPGPLPPLARKFTVTATGAAAKKWPESLGVFTRTDRWWRGRPVYTNTEGRLLHQGNVDNLGDDDDDDGDDDNDDDDDDDDDESDDDDSWGNWVIGKKLNTRALKGSPAYHSPASQVNWRYYTGSKWKPASVTVTASD